MTKLKSLKKAYIEMIDVMDLKDDDGNPIKIPKDADEEWFRNGIKEAISLIMETDEFSDFTTAIIEEVRSEMEDATVEELGEQGELMEEEIGEGTPKVEELEESEEEEEEIEPEPEPEEKEETPLVKKLKGEALPRVFKKEIDITPAGLVHAKNRVPRSSFTYFMDNVILNGGSWEDMIFALQSESDARSLHYKVCKSTITTHIRYRQKTNPEYLKDKKITNYGIE